MAGTFVETLKSALCTAFAARRWRTTSPLELNIALLERIGELIPRSARHSALLAVARLAAETIAKVEGPPGLASALRALDGSPNALSIIHRPPLIVNHKVAIFSLAICTQITQNKAIFLHKSCIIEFVA